MTPRHESNRRDQQIPDAEEQNWRVMQLLIDFGAKITEVDVA